MSPSPDRLAGGVPSRFAVAAAALGSSALLLAASGGLVAVLADQVVARGRYPVFETAPGGFLLEWGLAGVRAAALPALALLVTTWLAGTLVRKHLRTRFRKALLFVLPCLLALASVGVVSDHLRWEFADDDSVPNFQPAVEPYAAVEETATESATPRPDIVLITIDTLRADHLRFQGYPRNTMPHIEELVERGVAFTSAIAPAPMTQPSIASLMTGLPVYSIHPNFGRTQGFQGAFLRDGFTLLAERLQASGYDTAGFIANRHLKISNGYGQGFETFDEVTGMFGSTGEPRTRHAGHIVDAALSWLNSRPSDDDRPCFVWLHILDPHLPYEADMPGPWEDVDSEAFQAFSRDYDVPRLGMIADRLHSYADGTASLRPGELEFLVGRYDAAILQTDRHLGRFFDGWSQAGRNSANTLFVVTSDHGEEFLDHGGFQHAHTLFDELLHVPLVLAGPGFEGGQKVEAQVSLLDVTPTILQEAGLLADGESSGSDLAGESLQRIVESAGSAPDSALAFLGFHHIALRTKDRKLLSDLRIVEPGCPSGDAWSDLRRLFRARYVREPLWPEQDVPAEVFDLATDAGESTRLTDPWEVHRMVCRLSNYLRKVPVQQVDDLGEAGLSEEDKESLRALGYVID